MNKFEVGDRVVVAGSEAVTRDGSSAGMEGVVASVVATEVRVRMRDGRLILFSPDQLRHVPKEAPRHDGFKVGDRVVLSRLSVVDKAFHISEGTEGAVARLSGVGVEVCMDDGRSFWFTPDQLEHAGQPEATATGPTLQERRERIATAVLAGFAASPGEVGYLPSYAKAAVEWADALIKELDK